MVVLTMTVEEWKDFCKALEVAEQLANLFKSQTQQGVKDATKLCK